MIEKVQKAYRRHVAPNVTCVGFGFFRHRSIFKHSRSLFYILLSGRHLYWLLLLWFLSHPSRYARLTTLMEYHNLFIIFLELITIFVIVFTRHSFYQLKNPPVFARSKEKHELCYLSTWLEYNTHFSSLMHRFLWRNKWRKKKERKKRNAVLSLIRFQKLKTAKDIIHFGNKNELNDLLNPLCMI